MIKTNRRVVSLLLFVVMMAILFLSIVVVQNYRGNIRMKSNLFTESSRELKNPGRGFYQLYRFMITDEEVNYWKMVQGLYEADKDTRLTLVEINLQNYRDGEISRQGMDNVEALFRALSDLDKQLIVRFMYDWDGENSKYEPETIEIILRHMEQLKKVLHEAEEHIFVLQGLFIGNWGEMNGTKYLSDARLLELTEMLDHVTPDRIYLGVRTPEQWRRITGIQKISQNALEEHAFAGRISLYNDGMLGSESDFGTYGVQKIEGEVISERTKELQFQEELCKRVPNGGEVIQDNRYNDFDNAVKDLATMHVTYLNEGHDQTVLDKWKKVKVTEEGCYQGMDGYTYIERHLGYRLLIQEVTFQHNTFSDFIEIGVTMRNVGFAPIYARPEVGIALYDGEQDTYLLYEMEGDLCKLAGGSASEEHLTLTADIPVDRLLRTKYKVYFFLTDLVTGQPILLANEQEAGEYGYCIGSLELYDH